jgi:pimeloyl-ACP methyl ester carboxylesterase
MDTPLQGRRALVTSSAGKFPGGEPGTALVPIPLPASADSGDDLYTEETAALMAATQRPIAAAALEDKASRAGWKTIPSWTLVTLEDLAVPAESQRFMAARAKSQAVEIGASHAVTVSEPDAVADLILAAVRETQR